MTKEYPRASDTDTKGQVNLFEYCAPTYQVQWIIWPQGYRKQGAAKTAADVTLPGFGNLLLRNWPSIYVITT